jgi:hypothetical protein
MFVKACAQVRESIYGVLGSSQVSAEEIGFTMATAFMIAPGVLATAAHCVHLENNISKPVHTKFRVIRAPDVSQTDTGQTMETAQFMAEEPTKDIAVLRIDNPHSDISVSLETERVPIGTSCGSYGFPLS